MFNFSAPTPALPHTGEGEGGGVIGFNFYFLYADNYKLK